MVRKSLSTSARDAVHNFTHYAALVEAGAEVTITRRGRASLKLVRAESAEAPVAREALIKKVLAVRAAKSFKGKFQRSEAYEE